MPISFSPFLPFRAFGNTAGKPAAFLLNHKKNAQLGAFIIY